MTKKEQAMSTENPVIRRTLSCDAMHSLLISLASCGISALDAAKALRRAWREMHLARARKTVRWFLYGVRDTLPVREHNQTGDQP